MRHLSEKLIDKPITTNSWFIIYLFLYYLIIIWIQFSKFVSFLQLFLEAAAAAKKQKEEEGKKLKHIKKTI